MLYLIYANSYYTNRFLTTGVDSDESAVVLVKEVAKLVRKWRT